MKESPLHNAFKRWMTSKISPEDYALIKGKILHSSNDHLDSELKLLWEETSDYTPIDPKVKSEILQHIHQYMPAKKNLWFEWLKVAAIIAFPVLLALSAYLYVSNKSQSAFPAEIFSIHTDGGHKSQIFLPDGTHVWLNSDSKLNYSSDFNQTNRTIKVEGEAFFDVTQSTAHLPFRVETGRIVIVVHGTAFNVSAYPDEPFIQVTLVRGKIELNLNGNPDPFYVMSPNQQVSIARDNDTWNMSRCDAGIESLWTHNMLKFENAPAAEVFHKMERWYGMKIHVENMDTVIRYGFTLKSESLGEMLALINHITPVIYQINGEEVVIRYK